MKIDPLVRQFTDLRHQLMETEREVIRLKGHLKWDTEVANDLYDQYEEALDRRETLEEELFALSLELKVMKGVRQAKIENVIPFYRRAS
ncbi:MAG: hypothetical protein HY391_04030 [Deltaproteobacteria bacterium]|nr:hypothetical protein [Deltaproteobacteria bacterium]